MTARAELAFHILGELEVTSQGERIEIGRERQRALLAVLLLSSGQTVSTDRLIEGIWGERSPASADQLVRVYVSQLRALVGEDAIQTRTRGYALGSDNAIVDSRRFEELVAKARAERDNHHLDDALTTYDAALQFWRGPVLAGTPLEGDAAIRAGQIERMLLTAREERFDIALSLGHGPALVDELDRLVAAEPLRERLRAQQMLALYQAGRQADALASYREARRRFADELGLDPSPELQDLEREILRQDPALNPPTRPQKSAPRRRKARRALAGILLVALAGALGLILALDRSTGPATPRSLPTESLGALDPATGALHAALPLDAIPAAVTVGGDRVWVAAEQKRTLSEVNPRRLRIVNSVGLPAVPPHELVYGGGAIWATNGFDGTISRIGRDGLISPPFRPEADATGRLALGFGNGSLWVGSQDNVLSRLDPATGKLLATLHGVVTPESVTVGSGSVWVAQATRVDLLRIDARANRITHRIPLGGTATAVTTGDGSVWALTPSQNKLWRIDPRTNAVTAAIDVGAAPSTVVGDDSDVWVASEATGTLNRIDPRNDRIAQTVNLEHPLAGIALKYGRLWVATR